MILRYLSIILFGFPMMISAQLYEDYIGAGHDMGVSVSSSKILHEYYAEHTIVGSDISIDMAAASRLLAQATMGASYEDIETVVQMGINNWVDNQLSLQGPSFSDSYLATRNTAMTVYGIVNPDDRDDYLSFTFYNQLFQQSDKLRQKVAFALSQIFVISSTVSVLNNRGIASASYYDLLYQGAFSNFKDLLFNISMHPSMGVYLSHFRNEKFDMAQGTYPDENFAREIMQLFSIGLHELNNDGTAKLDDDGELIPTYDINDIEELAKVFTGFAGSELVNQTTATFFNGLAAYDFSKPMTVYDEYHDDKEKTLIDGTILAENTDGLEEVLQTIDVLFNHENVGPFIAKRLIQQLVKSNPSSFYVNRIATIFNDNGQGVRGDLKEVIRAILLDPEARECEWIADPYGGKLIQPVERLTKLFIAFDITNDNDNGGHLHFRDETDILGTLGQSFLASPTVFNFFSPFFAEKEIIDPLGLVSPEFQILNASTGIHYLNTIEDAIKDKPFINRTTPYPEDSPQILAANLADNPSLDFNDEKEILESVWGESTLIESGIEELMDRLDIILCRGQLTEGTRTLIKNNILNNMNSDYTAELAVKDAVYFIMISPDFIILK